MKKYSPIGELSAFAKEYAESLAATLGCTVCITDQDQIVAAAGYGKRELQDKSISKQLEQAIKRREQVISFSNERKYIQISDEYTDESVGQVICPILCEGDVLGAVVLLERSDKKKVTDSEQRIAACAANFLGRQMEQ